MIAGQGVDVETAVDESARLISCADAPTVEGFANITLEAAREAVLLARDISAVLVPRPRPSRSFLRSGLDAPEFTATLGKVHATADLVIFWRADPLRTHPRHLECYSFFAPLLNNKPRTMIVADDFETQGDHQTAREATVRVDLSSVSEFQHGDRDLILLLALLLSAKPLTHVDHKESRAINIENATRLARLIEQANHTHVFLGSDVAEDQSICDALHGLAARVRSKHHVSVSNLATPGNAWGVQELITWLLGTPGPLWMAAEDAGTHTVTNDLPSEVLAPIHFGPIDRTLVDAFDLNISLGVDLPGEETNHALPTGTAPRIVLGPQHDAAANVSFVVPGLDPRLRGTVMRNDGVPLTLCGDASLGVADPAVEILRRLRQRVSGVGEVQ